MFHHVRLPKKARAPHSEKAKLSSDESARMRQQNTARSEQHIRARERRARSIHVGRRSGAKQNRGAAKS